MQYSVSTITAVGKITEDSSTALDMTRLFDEVPIASLGGCMSIDSIQYGDKRRGAPRVKPNKKMFGNQITIVFRGKQETSNVINTKLFKNGNIQMTGIKCIPTARATIAQFCDVLNAITRSDKFGLCRLDVCLMNSNASLGFRIKRDLLFASVSRHHPRLQVQYEPCIYPGVMVKIMYNSESKTRDGECKCRRDLGPTSVVACDGKGNGSAMFNCRQISIAVFQSGNVIITGAHSYEQLDHSYDFLHRFVTDHRTEFELQ